MSDQDRNIRKIAPTGIGPALGYDPIAHAANMQWLKERDAERLSKPPQPPDPDAAIRPGKAIGSFTPAPSFQPPETCPDCAAGVSFNEHGHHHQ